MNGYGTSPLELMAADAMLRGKIFCQRFTYSARFVTGTSTALAANGTTSVDTQINGDSDFLMLSMNLTAFTAADTIIASPDYLLLLTASGAGRNLMDAAQMVSNITGSFQANRIPDRMCFPILLSAKNTLTSQLTNRTGTACNLCHIAFDGMKIFYTGGNRQEVFHAL